MKSPLKYVSNSSTAADNAVVHIDGAETKTGAELKHTALDALSLQLAIEHANKVHPRVKINGALIPFPIWSFEDFGQFGQGILLYFTLLRKLMFAFLFMFALSLPQIAFSFYFSFGSYDSIRLEQTMLSSMALGNTSSVEIPYVGKRIYKEMIGVGISTLDLLAILFFTFFIRSLRRTLQKEAELTDQLEITASDYTVRVQNIPKGLTNRNDLLEFFQERWGRVVDVIISFNDCELVQLYLKRGQLKHELMKAVKSKRSPEQKDKEMHRISERITKFDDKIQAFQAKFRRVAVDAFIMFNSQTSRDACLAQYPNTLVSKWLMPKHLRFQNQRIVVTKATEPSNILFENLKYSVLSIRIRRSITFLATVALMSVSLVIIYKASETQRRIVIANDTERCSGSETPSQEQALKGIDVACYCNSLSADQVQAQSDICGQWAQDRKMGNIISVVIALVIALVNAVLKSSIVQMVSFEKHTTLSAQERATTVKLLTGLFVNTGIIILLVNGDLSVIGLGSLFHGSYDDFNRRWYSDVGVSILFTMLVNILNPHIIPVLSIPVKRLYIRLKKSHVHTQKELNDLYTGPVFAISDRYASLLNTVFISLLFSPGIPALLATGALTFGFIFLFDKIALLRLYKAPPMFDESLALFSVNIVKYAVLMHTGMAVWFYSNTEILPSYEVSIFETMDSIAPSVLGINPQYLLGRIQVANSFCIFILFLIQIGQILAAQCMALPFCHQRSRRVSPVDRAADDNIEYLDALRSGIKLESYHMHDQPQYTDAFMRTASLKQLQPISELSEELAQARLGKAGKKKRKKRYESESGAAQGENRVPGNALQSAEAELDGKEKAGAEGHKRQTSDFLDERGMITVQCPSCARISNILWIDNGKSSQRYTCPYCGTIFAVAS